MHGAEDGGWIDDGAHNFERKGNIFFRHFALIVVKVLPRQGFFSNFAPIIGILQS